MRANERRRWAGGVDRQCFDRAAAVTLLACSSMYVWMRQTKDNRDAEAARQRQTSHRSHSVKFE